MSQADTDHTHRTLEYANSPPAGGFSRGTTVAVGLVLGVGFWLWLFALAFTGFHSNLVRALPLIFITGTAGILGAMAPRHWAWGAVALAIPAVVMNLSCFSLVALEGRGAEWGYSVVAAAAVICSFGGSALGRLIRRV